MENIFTQLGYYSSKNRSNSNDTEKALLVIHNSNGSIRWAWPENEKDPLFLKFYNESTYRSKFVSWIIRLIFLLQLQKLIFQKVHYFFSKLNNETEFDINSHWVLFTGTTGASNKGIIYTHKNGSGCFIKIALNSSAEALIKTEEIVMNQLNYSGIQTFVYPEVHSSTGKTTTQSDISYNQIRQNKLTDSHLNALSELNALTSMLIELKEHAGWKNIKNELNQLSEDERMPKGLIRKLSKIVSRIPEQKQIEVGLSHGDFTPWNMYIENNLPYIYDWELADPLKPLAFDAFHFIIQQGILVERKNWMQIKTDIRQFLTSSTLLRLSKFREDNVEDYLKLYLVFNTVYYLKVYADQKEWHEQVYWLFNTWNDALSDILESNVNQRELVLMDTFDFLLAKNYATIKFQNIYPENLSDLSDVDMCISKSAAKELFIYLQSHPLVRTVSANKKTFMSSFQVICKNKQHLNLDLIWKLKRKSLEFLDASDLLEKSYTNLFGIKMLNTYDNARYIGFFYKLNQSDIPTKYTYYEELLAASLTEQDKYLYPYFVDSTISSATLVNYVKRLKYNSGWKGIINRLSYLFDTINDFVKKRGTVITFSGVDGSGKSTIIESVKYRIEKQFRKRVIVLRHRPSLLPVLSVWTKGKKQADADIRSSLPRNGDNNSFLSSFLRFIYYYADYTLGQFIIYFKYVRRGYIVIYDRYYFDFINDSKRSNIILPSYIFKAGFLFILKPQVNFFLYADPEIILKRKQELDKETITELTTRYLTNFKELNQARNRRKYISINNTNIDDTLQTVYSQLSEIVA